MAPGRLVNCNHAPVLFSKCFYVRLSVVALVAHFMSFFYWATLHLTPDTLLSPLPESPNSLVSTKCSSEQAYEILHSFFGVVHAKHKISNVHNPVLRSCFLSNQMSPIADELPVQLKQFLLTWAYILWRQLPTTEAILSYFGRPAHNPYRMNFSHILCRVAPR